MSVQHDPNVSMIPSVGGGPIVAMSGGGGGTGGNNAGSATAVYLKANEDKLQETVLAFLNEFKGGEGNAFTISIKKVAPVNSP